MSVFNAHHVERFVHYLAVCSPVLENTEVRQHFCYTPLTILQMYFELAIRCALIIYITLYV